MFRSETRLASHIYRGADIEDDKALKEPAVIALEHNNDSRNRAGRNMSTEHE